MDTVTFAIPFTRFMTAATSAANSSGVEYPTVSGMLTTVAPAAMAASYTLQRKSTSVREASSAENSTSPQRLRAQATACRICRRQSAREMCSLYLRCRSLVAMNVWMRGRAAPLIAAAEDSMSFASARESEHTEEDLTASATALTDAKSPGEAAANPASITSTPSASSWSAMRTFSSRFIEYPGACSPSRSVVSNIWIVFMRVSFSGFWQNKNGPAFARSRLALV